MKSRSLASAPGLLRASGRTSVQDRCTLASIVLGSKHRWRTEVCSQMAKPKSKAKLRGGAHGLLVVCAVLDFAGGGLGLGAYLGGHAVWCRGRSRLRRAGLLGGQLGIGRVGLPRPCFRWGLTRGSAGPRKLWRRLHQPVINRAGDFGADFVALPCLLFSAAPGRRVDVSYQRAGVYDVVRLSGAWRGRLLAANSLRRVAAWRRFARGRNRRGKRTSESAALRWTIGLGHSASRAALGVKFRCEVLS